MLIDNPLPLIYLPLRPLVSPVIYCATLSATYDEILREMTMSSIMLIAISLALAELSSNLSPSDVKILKELLTNEEGEVNCKLTFNTPNNAISYLILKRSVFSLNHLRKIILLTLIVVSLAYLLNYLSSTGILIGAEAIPSMVPLIASLVLLQAFLYLSTYVLANDLSALWIYKVYSLDLRPLSRA